MLLECSCSAFEAHDFRDVALWLEFARRFVWLPVRWVAGVAQRGVLDVCPRVAPLRSVGAKKQSYFFNCGCHNTFKRPVGAISKSWDDYSIDNRINKFGWRLRNLSPEDHAKAQAAEDRDKSRWPKTGAEMKALLEKAAADEAAKAAPTEKTAGK